MFVCVYIYIFGFIGALMYATSKENVLCVYYKLHDMHNC
jgi:hypothetical protein